MQSDFRARVFTPIVLPLTMLGAVLLIAWSLAQVLLVVPALAAAALAVLLAAYILVMASLVATRRNITSRTLSVSLGLGMVAIVIAGAVANAAGMRELEHHEEGGAAEEGTSDDTPGDPEGAEEGAEANPAPDSGPDPTVDGTEADQSEGASSAPSETAFHAVDAAVRAALL